MNIKTKECWKINRGQGYAPIMSCEGIGDDHYFYVTPVWWLSGPLRANTVIIRNKNFMNPEKTVLFD